MNMQGKSIPGRRNSKCKALWSRHSGGFCACSEGERHKMGLEKGADLFKRLRQKPSQDTTEPWTRLGCHQWKERKVGRT